jgi:hypothetical protein
MEALFSAHSLVNTLKYKDRLYENVRIDWFVKERSIPPFPVETAMLHYDQLSESQRNDAEAYLKGLFTDEETRQLSQHLKEKKNLGVTVEEVTFPIAKMPDTRKSLALNPGTGFYRLYQKEGYNLPFKVEGFYNINTAEEKIMPDDQKTVISRNIKKEVEKDLLDKYYDGS